MVVWCAGAAVALEGLLRFADLSPLPFSQLVSLRTAFTIFVWLYLGVTLLRLGSGFEVIAIGTVPFLAQFYQIGLGRDFGQGTAIVRMLPYLVMTAAMVAAVIRRQWRPTANELLVFGVVWIVALVGVASSIDLTTAGVPAVFYVGVTLPAFYAYVESLAASRPLRFNELLLGLTVGMILLMAGNFVTLRLGLSVETALGFGSAASAIQAADFNSVAGYLLLLWPFALAFAASRSRLLVVALLTLLIATVFAGLSKTMLILTPVLVLASMPAYFRRLTLRNAISFLIVAVPAGAAVLWLLPRLSLTSDTLYRWGQRLEIEGLDLASISIADVISSVGPGSGAQEDRALVREQGWAMFRSSPIVGQGWGTFPHFSSVEHTSAHSVTVDVLSQVGLLGAALLWSLILLVLFRMARGFVKPDTQRRLLIAFVTAFMLWLVAAHTMGAQMFVVGEAGFTTGAVNGLLFVLFLSRRTMNHVLTNEAKRA